MNCSAWWRLLVAALLVIKGQFSDTLQDLWVLLTNLAHQEGQDGPMHPAIYLGQW